MLVWLVVSIQEASPTTPDAEGIRICLPQGQGSELDQALWKDGVPAGRCPWDNRVCASEAVPQTDVPQNCSS